MTAAHPQICPTRPYLDRLHRVCYSIQSITFSHVSTSHPLHRTHSLFPYHQSRTIPLWPHSPMASWPHSSPYPLEGTQLLLVPYQEPRLTTVTILLILSTGVHDAELGVVCRTGLLGEYRYVATLLAVLCWRLHLSVSAVLSRCLPSSESMQAHPMAGCPFIHSPSLASHSRIYKGTIHLLLSLPSLFFIPQASFDSCVHLNSSTTLVAQHAHTFYHSTP